MTAEIDETIKNETPPTLRQELRDVVAGLREDIQALRNDVQALRRKEAPDGLEALLSREEAAEVLGISVRSLDDLEASGRIRAIRIEGRVLYSPETLHAFIQSRAGEGRSQ